MASDLRNQDDPPAVGLLNSSWDAVNVEVRRGNESDCAKNATFDTRLLARDETWDIPLPDVDLCYRRDTVPGTSGGTWTKWRKVKNPGGYQTVEIV